VDLVRPPKRYAQKVLGRGGVGCRQMSRDQLPSLDPIPHERLSAVLDDDPRVQFGEIDADTTLTGTWTHVNRGSVLRLTQASLQLRLRLMTDRAFVRRRRTFIDDPHGEPSWHRFKPRPERRYLRPSHFDEAGGRASREAQERKLLIQDADATAARGAAGGDGSALTTGGRGPSRRGVSSFWDRPPSHWFWCPSSRPSWATRSTITAVASVTSTSPMAECSRSRIECAMARWWKSPKSAARQTWKHRPGDHCHRIDRNAVRSRSQQCRPAVNRFRTQPECGCASSRLCVPARHDGSTARAGVRAADALSLAESWSSGILTVPAFLSL
jgi:hypothetical protein